MLCPNCGTKTTNEHKFCRNCGMNLAPVAQAVAAHLSHGGAPTAAAAREAERRGTRRLTRGLFTGAFVFLLGLLMGSLPSVPFKVVGPMIALLGVIFSLVTLLSSMRADATTEAPPAPPTQMPEGAAPTGRLLHENTIEPVPASVTDHTTELLGVEIADRQERK